MGFLLKRMIITSFFSYYLKKYIRRLDNNLSSRNGIDTDTTRQCEHCGFISPNKLLIGKTNTCLRCGNKLKELSDFLNT